MEPKKKVSARAVYYHFSDGHSTEPVFLVLKRSTTGGVKNNPGAYQLPGGKVKKGERHEDAAVRESGEELNEDFLKHVLGAYSYVESHAYTINDGEYADTHITHHAYRCEVKPNAPITLSSEHEAHEWLTLKELEELKESKQLAFVPGALELIRKARAQIMGEKSGRG